MKTKWNLLLVIFVIMGLVGAGFTQAQAQEPVHYYVIPGGAGTNDCTSWENACDLQKALTIASSGSEVWAAAGTYKPTTVTTDRNATFQLKDGVAVYGGFAGTETSRDERSPQANLTVLSGDLNGDDGENFASNGENSYHVVTGATGALLDGVTITAGNANGTYPHDMGGGMYNSSSPSLNNVTFTGNTASNGGGMFNSNSSPTLNSVTFASNKASGYGGGGMYNSGSSPTLTNVIFRDNTASSGGGMRNSNSSPILSSVTFNGNSAAIGGGMYNTVSSPTLSSVTFSKNSAGYGGGMYNNGSSPTLNSVTFAGNTASYVGGGGMYNNGSSPTLTNVIFHDNSASSGGGGGMYNNGSSPTLSSVTFSKNSASSGGGMRNSNSSLRVIQNTILWGDTGGEVVNFENSSAVITSSVVQGGCPEGATCTDLISEDPLLGPLGNYGGSTQTLPLLPGSSAIDAGNDSLCPATDPRGVSRPQGAGCDIGAFEYDYTGIYYVTQGGSGTRDGQSWANASDLQNALKTARSGDEIWAAAGTYKPTTDTADPRAATFQLVSGVAVYGGFAGTESTRDERDPAANLTILSGDLNGDDAENFAYNGENSYHVVTGANNTILDGVIITAGNANGTDLHSRGGGMYNYGSSPTLSSVTFSGNSADYGGGAVYNTGNLTLSDSILSANLGRQGGAIYNGGTLTVTNTTFSGNVAKDKLSDPTIGFGGAVLNGGTMTVTGSTFSGNKAYGSMGQGGAIFNSGPLTVSSTTFSENWAQNSGGAIHDWGSVTEVNSSTFTGNSAAVGGAIYTYTSMGAKLTVANSTFSNNSATGIGGGLFNRGVTIVTNSTFYRTKLYNYVTDDAMTVNNSIVAGDSDWNSERCGGNPISGSKNLADDGSCGTIGFTQKTAMEINLGTLSDNGGPTLTIPLLAGSAAIDAGNVSVCPKTDQRGVTRPQGAACDIGAFEYEPPVTTYSISGSAFNDNNNNGIWDEDETHYWGADLYLDQGCDSKADSDVVTVGPPDFAYSFTDLTVGERYCVRYGGKNGNRQTTDPQASASLTADVTGFNVGIAYIWLDYNREVNLNGPVGVEYRRTLQVTNGDGPYDFTGTVWSAQPAGLDITTDAAAGTLTIFGVPTIVGEGQIDLVVRDANDATMAQTFLFWIQTDASETFTSSQNPSEEGQEVTFSLEFEPDYPFAGSVIFYDGDTVICKAQYLAEMNNYNDQTIDDNPASCSTSTLTVGTHQIRAEYTSIFGGYKSNTYTLEQIVNAQASVQADLSLTKTDSKDPIRLGAQLVYTLSVRNLGPNTSEGVVLTDKLDVSTTYVSTSVTKGWTCNYAANSATVTCTAPSLASGGSATFKITVTVNKTAKIGKDLINTAQVSSITFDPNLANNTVTQKTMVGK